MVPPSVSARSETDNDGRGWGGGLRRGVMGDDAATVEQLRAELRQTATLAKVLRGYPCARHPNGDAHPLDAGWTTERFDVGRSRRGCVILAPIPCGG